MRFLIVGASGFLGAHLRRRLDREGIPWLGTSRRPDAGGLLPLDLPRDDLLPRLPTDFLSAAGEIWVVHAASFGSIDACERQPAKSRAVNVEGPQRVIEALAPYGARHLFLSTNQVFDGAATAYREGDPSHPLNEYGRQKAAMEEYLLEHSPESLIFRLDKVVSGEANDGQLFAQWRNAVLAGKPILCLPGQCLAPTAVDDVVEAMLAACRQSWQGVYHVANSEVVERRRLAEMFLKATGLPGRTAATTEQELGLAAPRPRSAVLDCSKFLATCPIAFTPVRTLLERFRQSVS